LYARSFSEFGIDGNSKISLDAAYELTRGLGTKWMKDNEAVISKRLGPNFRVRRWDEWLDNPDLPAAIQRVRTFFEQPPLSKLVEADATGYLRRKFGNAVFPVHQTEVLIDFIIEECAVYFLHSSKENVRHVYPGKSLAVLRAMARNDIDVDPRIDPEMLAVFRNMKRTDVDLRGKNHAD
tara:strand:- start:4720 stop:5259 length:540 start_codon:yes stop_codon:yes gene_type:complete